MQRLLVTALLFSLVSCAAPLWGTYRPNLYFGLRPNGLEKSLMTGLMWHGTASFQQGVRIRHACEQSDALDSYTYTRHDGRSYAEEEIIDGANNVRISIRLLLAGDSWAYRVSGRPINPARTSRIALLQYFGNDSPQGSLALANEPDPKGLSGDISLEGSHFTGLGDFKIRVVNAPENSPVTPGPHVADYLRDFARTAFAALPVPEGTVWRVKDVINSFYNSRLQAAIEKYGRESLPDPAVVLTLPNEADPFANLYMLSGNYDGEWSVDVFFDSARAPLNLDSVQLTVALDAAARAYDERFAAALPLPGYNESQKAFARAITANLMGGVGYFYGPALVDAYAIDEWDDQRVIQEQRETAPRETEPIGLLTATPSRSFFPRGFYWDEGFHLQHIGTFDADLARDILKSWIDLVDSDGWVAREQILGDEARSRVPPEFQVQVPMYANPPTLVMALEAFVKRLQGGESEGGAGALAGSDLEESIRASASLDSHKAYLRSIYPKLKLHYIWFRRTQAGQIKEWDREASNTHEGYRWRGRTERHVLTSGLDDYPRAAAPHVGELHVDLHSWVAYFARTMASISEFLGEDEDAEDFSGHYEDAVDNLYDLHWSETELAFCDATIDPETEEHVHICHKGYVSLFPFLLGLVPADSPALGSILELIADPAELWSDFGIRSLSLADPYFGKDENYWRGPIWIQMNYLALSILHTKYAQEDGPYQTQAAEIYSRLRKNVVDNVYREFIRTGYVWEQYDALTGEGKRSHPFTGWTSLVALIMGEVY